MPAYIFRLSGDPLDFTPDPFELPDHHSARIEAVALLAECMSDHPEWLGQNGSCKATVCDAVGEELFAIEMRHVARAQKRRRAQGAG